MQLSFVIHVIILYKELITKDAKKPKTPIIIAYISDVPNVIDNAIIDKIILPIVAMAVQLPLIQAHFY